MIRLIDVDLPPDTLVQLADYQQVINDACDYASQKKLSQTEFKRLNVDGNITFDAVKVALKVMCSGAKRCCYCEDSMAVQIEHIAPKSFYPEYTFVWRNYLYACGRCNNPKNNKFAVFATDTGIKTNLTRPKNAPVVPPISGTPLLINPRFEDPFDFLFLDIMEKKLGVMPEEDSETAFHFSFVGDDEDTPEYQRADYTIETLDLNNPDLVAARRSAYRGYRAALKEYISERDAGRETRTYVTGIMGNHHPSVWYAMKQFRDKIPELKVLFDDAKEALDW
jgi:hypothetical protein